MAFTVFKIKIPLLLLENNQFCCNAKTQLLLKPLPQFEM